MKISHALLCATLLSAGFAGTASAECFDYQGTPTGDTRWVVGLDNVAGTADDHSLQTDNELLRTLRPQHCSGPHGCDIILYRIQWFSGGWSGHYIPGFNDVHYAAGGIAMKPWAMFNDHNYKMTYCN